MTQPDLSPEQLAPSLVGVGAQEIQNRARALGLTWTLRPATIQTYYALTGTVTALYDGDTVPLDMISLVGGLQVSQRVMGVAVPPGGNYVIGKLGADPNVGAVLGANWTNNGTVVTSVAAVEAAVPAVQWDQQATFTLGAGLLFMVHITGAVITSSAQIRVRVGTASTTGTQLILMQRNTLGDTFDHIGYFKNSTQNPVVTKLSLTVQANAGNSSLYGDANLPLMMVVTAIGSIAANPTLAASVVSV